MDSFLKKDDKNDNTIFRDPRYTTSNTRDDSRRQLNNNKNLKIQSVLPGLESSSNLGSFEETNYENFKKAVNVNNAINLKINYESMQNDYLNLLNL